MNLIKSIQPETLPSLEEIFSPSKYPPNVLLSNKIGKLFFTGTQIAVHGRQQRGDGQ